MVLSFVCTGTVLPFSVSKAFHVGLVMVNLSRIQCPEQSDSSMVPESQTHHWLSANNQTLFSSECLQVHGTFSPAIQIVSDFIAFHRNDDVAVLAGW